MGIDLQDSLGTCNKSIFEPSGTASGGAARAQKGGQHMGLSFFKVGIFSLSTFFNST